MIKWSFLGIIIVLLFSDTCFASQGKAGGRFFLKRLGFFRELNAAPNKEEQGEQLYKEEQGEQLLAVDFSIDPIEPSPNSNCARSSDSRPVALTRFSNVLQQLNYPHEVQETQVVTDLQTRNFELQRVVAALSRRIFKLERLGHFMAQENRFQLEKVRAEVMTKIPFLERERAFEADLLKLQISELEERVSAMGDMIGGLSGSPMVEAFQSIQGLQVQIQNLYQQHCLANQNVYMLTEENKRLHLRLIQSQEHIGRLASGWADGVVEHRSVSDELLAKQKELAKKEERLERWNIQIIGLKKQRNLLILIVGAYFTYRTSKWAYKKACSLYKKFFSQKIKSLDNSHLSPLDDLREVIFAQELVSLSSR